MVDALQPIQLAGEGRGRIGYLDQSYLFRFESAFKKDNWLLSLTIPMHGQEVLVFEDLAQPQSSGEMQSLEVQIDQEIKKQSKLENLKNENIVVHLRSVIRFIKAQELGLETQCDKDKCFLGKEEFIIQVLNDGVQIKKIINPEYFIEFTALYLEKEFYSRVNFYLKKVKSKENFFSLELFLQNK